MDITPKLPKDKNSITSYGPEGFRVNEILYKKSLIVAPNKLLEIDIKSLEEITLDILKQQLSSESEILLIGSGSKHLRLSEDLKNQIKDYFPLISIAEMTSSAACRTYNILMVEDRNVAVILMPFNL